MNRHQKRDDPGAVSPLRQRCAVLVAGWILVLNPLPAPAEPERPAEVSVITSQQAPSIAAGSVVVRVGGGEIDDTVARRLVAAIDGLAGDYDTIILRLDTAGGSDRATIGIIRRLEALVASGVRLRTMVNQGDICASACILIFMQGQERYAGNASVWGFHGACLPGTNIPVPQATRQLYDALEERGVSPAFIQMLEQCGYLSQPGVYWLSGYELSEVHDAGIITHLIPAWERQAPRLPPELDRAGGSGSE
jgi:hypothetical protein